MTRDEVRSLLLARNELATYLSSSGSVLPPMVRDPHTCQRCDHVQTCVLFHKAVEQGDARSSGLGETFTKVRFASDPKGPWPVS